MDQSAFDKQVTVLREQRAAAKGTMREAFAADPKRFERFSATDGDLLLDWSKCAVDAGTMATLEKLAGAADLEGRRAAMFEGKKINITENRAVLHTALRNLTGKSVVVDGQDTKADVIAVLDAMGAFADAIRSGKAAGATGKKITDIVNIGIGGSDLGPAMVTLALAPYHDGPRTHYVSNVDGAHIHDTLKGLSAETTLFIVASKTFTTVETMTNAETARKWVEKALGSEAIGKHFAAVSTALDLVAKFGIASDRVFGFWDWVGGRYSVWSAIGLPVMIAIGPRNFRAFLDGAHEMDEHFRTTPLQKNLPVLLGLIGWWHRVVCKYPARAVIPYDQRLSRLPAYLQQLDMESNGKSVTLDGGAVATPTGPLVWGEPGTNGQHAFFQLLHQGTDYIPVEFLAAAISHEPELKHQHDLLLANCLAQSEAFMKGRTLEEARAQMLAKGMKPADVDRIAPHRVFSGNRPSLTILYRKLDPRTLGRLIALYEHRVFVEGTLFNINSFDQWGVELGKELATGLLPVVEGKETAAKRDASTAGLVAHIHQLRGAE
ncbi:glucose-6-phosphate isomerase [Mesorhizobium sp. M1C.F.Ca.ET.193.01.1.1]|uniref:glucose-6-phosphate isomerase n=1 Tax=unclassified Mesorhizobium TaxID=325217 RepID=UPI000FD41755|nr:MULTISPECIES: glucose-6-phosphate isomerase [unclassified Mesorhizobium]TGT04239.1 glucose-6-phosphate isomerase [bacterium M00.F.Ca.ET.177.01.1.1]TGQ56829.1 glucose-6-phosphate isomerase [Mesorhizobium sp. M1C.F.Ca.ET.210.01.1.1]TGQ75597.1 glucose-6-phosphate isomerase [Mesorhizobium sp. M1C.F.Ca.ET.212.01.1.1]TGR14005.1 glucose-6-phosphate isomerase [Mesorhizobium sp. M1C.F.Ca.ET.204.01.1.1]TGR34260.1 glucose-6-phosphate isomerase [Mesorhizobium sp. M1C.F.Ca.ET.196.01.1.1]